MDEAWIGVIGGAVGVMGTLAAAGLTQWRSEVQRNKDRAAELERMAAERAAETARWEREREADREDRQVAHWEDQRRTAYRDFAVAAIAWRDAITRANAQLDVHEQVRGERSRTLEPDEAKAAHDAEFELLLLGTYEIRNMARSVIERHDKAWSLVNSPDATVAERDAALKAAGQSYMAYIEMVRVELGVVTQRDLNKVAAQVHQLKGADKAKQAALQPGADGTD